MQFIDSYLELNKDLLYEINYNKNSFLVHLNVKLAIFKFFTISRSLQFY